MRSFTVSKAEKRIPNVGENKSFKLGLERMGFLCCVLTICILLELQDL